MLAVVDDQMHARRNRSMRNHSPDDPPNVML